MPTTLNRDGEVGPGYFAGFAALSIALALVSWLGDVSLTTQFWIFAFNVLIVAVIFMFAAFNRRVRRARAEHERCLDALLDQLTDPDRKQS